MNLYRLVTVLFIGLAVTASGCVTPTGGYGGGYATPSSQPVSARRATCSGCGGTGRGADFLRRQGRNPSTPGYKDSACPRCGGNGWVY